VPGESGLNFLNPAALCDLVAITYTFLLKERIYQRRLLRESLTGEAARWPGKDRSHGVVGVKEAVLDMGGIQPNDLCPCGSGLKYRLCCRSSVELC
jgi:hypothetical protein